jgi:hypothetical protein
LNHANSSSTRYLPVSLGLRPQTTWREHLLGTNNYLCGHISFDNFDSFGIGNHKSYEKITNGLQSGYNFGINIGPKEFTQS